MEEHIYRMLVEQTTDYALLVLDPTGHITTWNAGAQRINGYSASEIIGRHFSTFYTKQACESRWPDYELRVATVEGRFEDEGWRVRKDGTQFWASVVITALRDDSGKLIGFSKITRDLTERKRQQEALRESEERFRLLVEGVVDYAIFMLDERGSVSSWNSGAERILGYSRDQIIGRHFSRFYDPADIHAGKPWEELATARTVGRAEDEGWRLRADGERFWARVVVNPLYDSDGKLRGFAKVTQDLTSRRHLQELEEASKNLTEFTAVLAHELKNPLAPIRTAVQVLGKLPCSDASVEHMHQIIDRQSAHLARIVDDLVDISRVSRGLLKIDRSQVNLQEVIRTAIEAVTPVIDSARHHLEVAVPAELCVNGDFHRLMQILANLLGNAARYTPAGGRISITAAREEFDAVIRVRDNGMGIEPDMLQRIFDMFVRAGSSALRSSNGLGIGLALSRRLAELHGGTLEARSEGEGKGSEFVLRLPVTEQRSLGPTGRRKAPAHSAPRRVLVADDNVDAATSLGSLLAAMGHETKVVYDGTAALALVDAFAPDFVLLDIGMPGLDGYDVAKRLCIAHPQRNFLLVAVTGWGQQADRARSKAAGFDLHLAKPVEVDDLENLLSQRTPRPQVNDIGSAINQQKSGTKPVP